MKNYYRLKSNVSLFNLPDYRPSREYDELVEEIAKRVIDGEFTTEELVEALQPAKVYEEPVVVEQTPSEFDEVYHEYMAAINTGEITLTDVECELTGRAK